MGFECQPKSISEDLQKQLNNDEIIKNAQGAKLGDLELDEIIKLKEGQAAAKGENAELYAKAWDEAGAENAERNAAASQEELTKQQEADEIKNKEQSLIDARTKHEQNATRLAEIKGMDISELEIDQIRALKDEQAALTQENARLYELSKDAAEEENDTLKQENLLQGEFKKLVESGDVQKMLQTYNDNERSVRDVDRRIRELRIDLEKKDFYTTAEKEQIRQAKIKKDIESLEGNETLHRIQSQNNYLASLPEFKIKLQQQTDAVFEHGGSSMKRLYELLDNANAAKTEKYFDEKEGQWYVKSVRIREIKDAIQRAENVFKEYYESPEGNDFIRDKAQKEDENRDAKKEKEDQFVVRGMEIMGKVAQAFDEARRKIDSSEAILADREKMEENLKQELGFNISASDPEEKTRARIDDKLKTLGMFEIAKKSKIKDVLKSGKLEEFFAKVKEYEASGKLNGKRPEWIVEEDNNLLDEFRNHFNSDSTDGYELVEKFKNHPAFKARKDYGNMFDNLESIRRE